MAMYYQGSSEIQPDGLQTLYLMNPNFLSNYSDTQPNEPFFNQFVSPPDHPSRPSPSHQQDHIQTAQNPIPRFNQTIYGLTPDHHPHDHQSAIASYGNLKQITPRGLSLSLTVPHQKRGFDKSTISTNSEHDFITGQIVSSKNCSSPTGGVQIISTVNVIGSKYVKAAQELLDEVANVGVRLEGLKDKAKIIKESARIKGDESGENGNKNGRDELTTAQRQEIQMKKAKLNTMSDEVDQRYKQYHHQMQLVVTSYEQVAGIGSAKCYTHVALKTILKQFRCLKNTISSQIKALNKTLGEEENSGKTLEGSRLKFVDRHLRQQRTMQQLGMMQNNAWRPQRGLPEKAVSVLRAWLFEHFLHPYPKDSDKHMLAKQTGLTKSQVSNWFINARVRLWKPMVEDMYKEETKNQETTSENTTQPDNELINSKPNPLQDDNNITTTSTINNLNTLQSQSDKSSSTLTTSRPGFSHLIASLNAEKNHKKPRHENQDNSPSSIVSVDMETKAGETSKGFDNFTFGHENYLSMAATNSTTPTRENYLPGFCTFNADHHQIPTTAFHGNNNFSLTLALPPSGTSQGVTHQNNFFSHGNFEFATRIEPVESHQVNGINQTASSHPNNIGNYQILDFQNRKPLPAQLFPDHFVT